MFRGSDSIDRFTIALSVNTYTDDQGNCSAAVKGKVTFKNRVNSDILDSPRISACMPIGTFKGPVTQLYIRH